jgi:hypothetical protein
MCREHAAGRILHAALRRGSEDVLSIGLRVSLSLHYWRCVYLRRAMLACKETEDVSPCGLVYPLMESETESVSPVLLVCSALRWIFKDAIPIQAVVPCWSRTFSNRRSSTTLGFRTEAKSCSLKTSMQSSYCELSAVCLVESSSLRHLPPALPYILPCQGVGP